MNRPASRLVIRADAGPDIGYGHVMRCIALGQAWQARYGTVLFVTRHMPRQLQRRLAAERFEIRRLNVVDDRQSDVQNLLKIIHRGNHRAVVADGYQFGSAWQRAVQQAEIPLLVIDDYAHLEHYSADLILNQNPHASDELYRGKFSGDRLLTGSRYALLRSEFLQSSLANQQPASTPRLLVTLGGFDPGGVTGRVVRALEMLAPESFQATVVSPGADIESGRSEIAIVPFGSNMAELIANCDLAVCAGGSTNWEMSLLGVPRMVIVLAENQQDIAGQLDRLGCCHNLGWHDDVTAEQICTALRELISDQTGRQAMAAANRQLVDGQGASRVCEVLAQWPLTARQNRRRVS